MQQKLNPTFTYKLIALLVVVIAGIGVGVVIAAAATKSATMQKIPFIL